MLGIAGQAAFAYTNGIFMEQMTGEFGWTKTQLSSATLLQMLIGLVVAPLAARVLDRVGSRPVLPVGITPFALGLFRCAMMIVIVTARVALLPAPPPSAATR